MPRAEEKSVYQTLAVRQEFAQIWQKRKITTLKMFAPSGNPARRDGDLDELDESNMSTDLWSLRKNTVRPVLV